MQDLVHEELNAIRAATENQAILDSAGALALMCRAGEYEIRKLRAQIAHLAGMVGVEKGTIGGADIKHQ